MTEFRLWHRLIVPPLLVLAVVLLCLSGCASAPLQGPQSSLFSGYAVPDVAMPRPAALPERPRAALLQTPQGDLLVFDAAAAQQLLLRDRVAEQNTELAGHCAAGFDAQAEAYAVLLRQAQAQEQLYNHLGQRWADAERQLDAEQRSRAVENWFNRALLFAVLGLAL